MTSVRGRSKVLHQREEPHRCGLDARDKTLLDRRWQRGQEQAAPPFEPQDGAPMLQLGLHLVVYIVDLHAARVVGGCKGRAPTLRKLLRKSAHS